jgi:8-oxo-dGTP pyrophosphatase MutT (NUDIX family)
LAIAAKGRQLRNQIKNAAIRVIGGTISDAPEPHKRNGVAHMLALGRTAGHGAAKSPVYKRSMVKQPPLSLNGARKGDVRTQFAALCYRVRRGKVQVLLITSRGAKRWIVPKGWPMEGKTPAASAAREAWEEAGVTGKADENCLGVYSYAKSVGAMDDLPCVAMLYPVLVKSLAKKFPESGQRRRRWVSRKKAARLVEQPDLARLILNFEPRGKRLRS